MSYSFLEPEDPAICECKYDEVRDRMDREDCPLHCNLVDDAAEMEVRTAKGQSSNMGIKNDTAA
jgi:hypothetical protein